MYRCTKSASASSHEAPNPGGEGPGRQRAVALRGLVGRGERVVVLRRMGVEMGLLAGVEMGLAKVGGEEMRKRRMMVGKREGMICIVPLFLFLLLSLCVLFVCV